MIMPNSLLTFLSLLISYTELKKVFVSCANNVSFSADETLYIINIINNMGPRVKS